jgi:penicillin-binding protein-related factor A (putative recombinase)
MPRQRKKKPALEKTIETAILIYLNFLPECFAWKNNSTGVFDPVKKKYRNNKNKFVINGVSDILGIYKGKLLAIEVKRLKSDKPSEDQVKFLERVKKLGGISGVARSIDDAKKIINDGGIDEHSTEELPE